MQKKTLRKSRRFISTREVISHLLLIVFVLLTIYPIFFLLNVSAKSRFQFERNPLAVEVPESPYTYVLAWKIIRRSMLNTALITAISLAGLLVAASITAYIFARYSFPGKEVFWYSLIGLLMIPGILTLIPLLVLTMKLRLVNTLWAAILPYIAGGQPFAIFVLRTFIAQLPEELFEAARIDGANHLDILIRLVMPLSTPILVVIGILHVLHAWNDIAWPLLVLNNLEVRTVALQLLVFQNPSEDYPTAAFAGYIIASVPLFVMFFLGMRQFVAGVITGAVKL
jgi:ABC-type glycerol-3-phosphate transport system permease component